MLGIFLGKGGEGEREERGESPGRDGRNCSSSSGGTPYGVVLATAVASLGPGYY